MSRMFYTGMMHGKKVVVNKCGVGKVSSALTVSALFCYFKIESLIFVGTAGALGKDVSVGDIVISNACV